MHGPGSPRCLFSPLLQKWAVFTLSASSSLGCLSCLLGLAISIGLTLGSQGRVLLAPCTFANVVLAPVSRECPFDPTRVYVSPQCAVGCGLGLGVPALGMGGCRWGPDTPCPRRAPR